METVMNKRPMLRRLTKGMSFIFAVASFFAFISCLIANYAIVTQEDTLIALLSTGILLPLAFIFAILVYENFLNLIDKE